MSRHRTETRAGLVGAVIVLAVALVVVLVLWATDDAPVRMVETQASRVGPCQTLTEAEVRAVFREEMDRAVVEVPGRKALWSQASVLARLVKLADQ